MANIMGFLFAYLQVIISACIIIYLVVFLFYGQQKANQVVSKIVRSLWKYTLRVGKYIGRVVFWTVINTGTLVARLIVGWGRPTLVIQAWDLYRQGMANVIFKW